MQFFEADFSHGDFYKNIQDSLILSERLMAKTSSHLSICAI